MRIGTILITAGIMLLEGCNAAAVAQGAQEQALGNIAALHRDSQCHQPKGLQWIGGQQELDTLYRSLQQHIISPAPAGAPQLDFSRFGVLLVSMGSKPSGGYQVSLDSDTLQWEAGQATATVLVRWLSPKPGMMLTQALTSPCLLLKLPLGEYRRIVVMDQHSARQGSLELP